jgi:hypothetical protein
MTKRALITLIVAAPALLCVYCVTESIAAGQSNEQALSGKTAQISDDA